MADQGECYLDFLSDVFNCDTNELPAVDDSRVQSEISRLNAAVSDNKEKLTCSQCNVRFAHAKSLTRHQRENRCLKAKRNFICQNCGKNYQKQAFLAAHLNRGKCIKPRNSKQSSDVSDGASCSHKCDKCGKCFSKRGNLQKHALTSKCGSLKVDRVFGCRLCPKKFSSAGTLKLHMKTHANSATPEGESSLGGNSVDSTSGCDYDDNDDGNNGSDADIDGNFQIRQSLFHGALIRYKLKAQQAEQYDLMYFFSNRRQNLKKNLLREMRTLRQVKWYTTMKIEMEKLNSDGEIEDQASPLFRSFTKQVLVPEVIDSQIDEAYFKMLNSFDTFRADGSGWHIKKVLHMEQTITKFRPLGGSCTLYQLPETLLRKRCLLNVTGPPELDGYCFEYAILAGLHTDENVTGQLPWSDLHAYRHTLKFDGIAGSGRYMPVTSICDFENHNGLSVNVYGYEDGDVFPVHVTQNYRQDRHVNLLLLCASPADDHHDNEVENFQTIADHRRGHYCVIKNMSRLVSSQAGQRHGQVFVCMRCLTVKPTAESLTEHERLCRQEETDPVNCVMPEPHEKWLKFRNLGKRMRVSFVIVANFICYTVPLLSHQEPVQGYEVRERRLDPCAYSYLRISIDDSHPKDPVFYRGSSPADTMEHFLSDMAAEEEEVFSILSQTQPMVWCDEGLANIQASNDECFVCGDPFLPNERIVVDHSHVSGKIRGRSHNSCNLRMKEASFLPIVLTDLSHFEGRLIMQSVARFGPQSIKVLPKSQDTYISISVNRCRYLDFKRFLRAPLHELVGTLHSKSGLDSFKFVKKHVPTQLVDLATRKQVFFSDYLDCAERLTETNVPPIAGFYDRVNDLHISQSDYQNAQHLWSVAGMTVLEDYLRHYMTVQNLQFADVLESFRDTMMLDYRLDVLHYYSLPGFSWDACLLFSGVTLELLTCEEMHAVILDGIRGGTTVVGTPRLAQANNQQMPEGTYDPGKPTSFMYFLDFNSLYPSVMSEFRLPTHGFRWLSDHEIDRLDIMNIPADSDTGYILVCDIEYPDGLHDLHDAYPMCPENIVVGEDDVSQYTRQLAADCNVKLRPGKKLCLTLKSKTNYAVHYRALQFYLRQGLVLKHIHKVVRFTQTLWLHDFMKYTTEKRCSSTNEFDGMLYKSVACNVFGKTIENVKQRMNVKIVTSSEKLRRLVSKPSFQAVRIFDTNLAAVQLFKDKVKLNKPITVGYSVLELSKLKMYQFWYDVVLKEFRDYKVSLLMSDTDSFLVHIEGDPVNQYGIGEILLRNREYFDFSRLQNGHPLKDNTNAQVPGKMKLQLPDSVIMEAVVLSSKCYSVLTDRGSLSTMKGTPGSLQHEIYRDCIAREKCYNGKVKSIKNFGQILYHVSTERRMLSPIDTKRFYFSSNESRSYGHWRLRNAVVY